MLLCLPLRRLLLRRLLVDVVLHHKVEGVRHVSVSMRFEEVRLHAHEARAAPQPERSAEHLGQQCRREAQTRGEHQIRIRPMRLQNVAMDQTHRGHRRRRVGGRIGRYIGRYISRYISRYIGHYIGRYIGRYISRYIGRRLGAAARDLGREPRVHFHSARVQIWHELDATHLRRMWETERRAEHHPACARSYVHDHVAVPHAEPAHHQVEWDKLSLAVRERHAVLVNDPLGRRLVTPRGRRTSAGAQGVLSRALETVDHTERMLVELARVAHSSARQPRLLGHKLDRPSDS